MTVADWTPSFGNDWDGLLGQEFEKEYWPCLQKRIAQERLCFKVFPPDGEVFAALRLTQCSDTKVVIVGQDPYYGADQAHGLAFSVRRGARVPRTLRNIYQELQEDLHAGVDPQQGNLESWAHRGVLLLNAVLTVREGAPRSHRRMGWEQFTDWSSNSQRRSHIPCTSSGARMPKRRRGRLPTRRGSGSSSQHTRRRNPPVVGSSRAGRSAGRTKRFS
ncbi:MAG: uracil-DNA glycosylase, partial [Aeromicrobium sp.]